MSGTIGDYLYRLNCIVGYMASPYCQLDVSREWATEFKNWVKVGHSMS